MLSVRLPVFVSVAGVQIAEARLKNGATLPASAIGAPARNPVSVCFIKGVAAKAMSLAGCSAAPFGVTVAVVVGKCPEEQMIGIDAFHVVALVADAQSMRNRSMKKSPGKAMRGPVFFVEGEPSIAPIWAIAGPLYASGFSRRGSLHELAALIVGRHAGVVKIVKHLRAPQWRMVLGKGLETQSPALPRHFSRKEAA